MMTSYRTQHLGFLIAVAPIMLAVFLSTAQAVPPHPRLVNSPDPSVQRNLALYRSLQRGATGMAIDRPDPCLARAVGAAVTGSRRLLVILVRFSDHDSAVAATYFDSLMFDHTAQTVWDYYDEVSYGTFSIDAVDLPSTIGWRLAPQTYAYYTYGSYGWGEYPHNAQKLVEDLLAQVDPVVNFANYDADGNGYVDGVVVVHSGTGAEISGSTDDIWSHMSTITPQVRDGKIIRSYSIQPEFWDAPGDMTIGVYCHELGHLLLNLPDLYDYDGDSRGLGLWSLMATGSWGGPTYGGNYPAHPDAWSRVQAGWVTPTVVAAAINNCPIPAVKDSAKIFKLWTDGGPIGDEYYLVENRRKSGYDTYLPASGLCIYHVDEAVATGNDNQWYPGYTGDGHYLVALEQADGLWELEQNVLYDYGDAADPFPGSTTNRTFAAATTPSSNAYGGTPTYVVITDISNTAQIMTADFQVTLGSGILAEDDGASVSAFSVGPNYPNPFNPNTRIDYWLPASGPVTVDVFNLLGQKVRTLWSGRQDRGWHTVSWDGADAEGRAVPAGVFFSRVVGLDQIKTGKMVLVK